MTVFATFVVVLSTVTYASVLTLRWFALEFIYDDIGAMWGGVPLNVGVATLLLLVAIAVSSVFPTINSLKRNTEFFGKFSLC